jgi:hypothetical protein
VFDSVSVPAALRTLPLKRGSDKLILSTHIFKTFFLEIMHTAHWL